MWPCLHGRPVKNRSTPNFRASSRERGKAEKLIDFIKRAVGRSAGQSAITGRLYHIVDDRMWIKEQGRGTSADRLRRWSEFWIHLPVLTSSLGHCFTAIASCRWGAEDRVIVAIPLWPTRLRVRTDDAGQGQP